MSYGIVHHFPGGTEQQYLATITAVHGSRTSLPKGQIFHSAGASSGGWTIVAIHESKASWEKFRNETLIPRMQQGIAGGFATPPAETSLEVSNQLSMGPSSVR